MCFMHCAVTSKPGPCTRSRRRTPPPEELAAPCQALSRVQAHCVIQAHSWRQGALAARVLWAGATHGRAARCSTSTATRGGSWTPRAARAARSRSACCSRCSGSPPCAASSRRASPAARPHLLQHLLVCPCACRALSAAAGRPTGRRAHHRARSTWCPAQPCRGCLSHCFLHVEESWSEVTCTRRAARGARWRDAGLRNDAGEAALAMRQRWRLADIRAEEVAFVLLSSYLNHLDAQASLRGFVWRLNHRVLAPGRACLAWAPAGSCSRGQRLHRSSSTWGTWLGPSTRA